MLEHIKDTVYTDLIIKLNSDDYFIENIETIYITKEYIKELSYNSESSIFLNIRFQTLNPSLCRRRKNIAPKEWEKQKKQFWKSLCEIENIAK